MYFPNISDQLAVLDLISIFAAIGVGYYSARLFAHMRLGRLEKGWRLMTYGASILGGGYVLLSLEDFFTAYSLSYEILDYLGTAIGAAGLVFIMWGLKSHYKAWSLPKELVS